MSSRHRSIRFRFSVSLLLNLARAGVSFCTGLVVARGIGPSNYGDLNFLLGSFIAIRALLDMGTSSAFFTFFSQRQRGLYFVNAYLFWQLLQFLFVFSIITVFLPQPWFEHIWLGHGKSIVVSALAASFLQQQVWQTFSQLGDSLRQTHHVQFIGLIVVIIHFILVFVIWNRGMLGVQVLLIFICIEYLIASVIVWKRLRPKVDSTIISPPLVEMIREYWQYCSPLIVVSLFGFAYTFLDNWLLQKFGGSRQQGFYAIANQFSTISMFATISMLQIFWKEIAEAYASDNLLKVQSLYIKVSRLLYGIAAIVAGGLVPWSKEIISLTLGDAYIESSPIFMLMLLYPLHQTAGQVTSTLLSATAKTHVQMKIGIISALASMPLSYFILASHDAVIPGLGLGAIGLTLKLIVLTVVTVNFISWWFCRSHKWKFDWIYQIQSVIGALVVGWLSYCVGKSIGQSLHVPLFFEMAVSAILYVSSISLMIWSYPEVIGMRKSDIIHFIDRFMTLFNTRLKRL